MCAKNWLYILQYFATIFQSVVIMPLDLYLAIMKRFLFSSKLRYARALDLILNVMTRNSSILSFKFMVFFGASFSIQSVCADTFLFVTFFSPVCALHFGNKKWFDLNWNILKDMKLFVTSYIADNSAFGLQKMIYVINTTFRIGLVKIFASSIHCSTTLLILSSCFLYFYSASIGEEMVLLKDDAQHLRISL